ncbi:DNA polymerase zeta catalytic subunit [Malassezia pachydermatis]
MSADVPLYLTHVEHTLEVPDVHDTFRSAFQGHGSQLPRVPVIHAFGVREDGVHCCVHVHNVFPYLYVEYNGELEPETGASL